jgi:hypothetical protein
VVQATIETPEASTGQTPYRKPSNRAVRRHNLKGGRPRKYDRDAARVLYIEGTPKDPSDPDGEREFLSLNEVAESQGIPTVRVREWSGAEAWVEQRRAYQARLEQVRQRRRATKLAKDAVDFDERAITAARLGATIVQTRLGEIARDMREQAERRAAAERLRANGVSVNPADFKTVIDSRELGVLATAMKEWHSIGQRAFGTDVQKVEHTGMDGGPIELEVTTVAGEMAKKDPERLASFLAAAERAGLFGLADESNVLEGEAIDDEDGYDAEPE